MGWYTGWYILAWPLVVSLMSLLTRHIVKLGEQGARQAMTSSTDAEAAETEACSSMTLPALSLKASLRASLTASPTASRGDAVSLASHVSHSVAAHPAGWLGMALLTGGFVSAWPYLGVIADGYVFPDRYCVLNLQHGVLGGAYVLALACMAAGLGEGVGRLLCAGATGGAAGGAASGAAGRLRALCVGLIGLGAVSQLLPLAVVGRGLGGASTCTDPLSKYTLFPLLAVTLHGTQLGSAALLGLLWPREMNALLTAK